MQNVKYKWYEITSNLIIIKKYKMQKIILDISPLRLHQQYTFLNTKTNSKNNRESLAHAMFERPLTFFPNLLHMI